MHEKLGNLRESKSAASSVSPNKRNGKQILTIEDNRPEAVTQRKLQSMARNISLRKGQENLSTVHLPVQMAVNVSATKREDGVVITAEGQSQDFNNGDKQQKYGWNNVDTYKASAIIGQQQIESNTYSNDFLNAQAGHVLAQQNGGKGSDINNVFGQDGGVNNSAYRKDFEEPMRSAIDKAPVGTNVRFRAVLYGKGVAQGLINKKGKDLYAEKIDSDGEDEWLNPESRVITFMSTDGLMQQGDSATQLGNGLYSVAIGNSHYLAEYKDGIFHQK